jgi:type I restriction enzyme S subunit
MSELPEGWVNAKLSDVTVPFETMDPTRLPDDNFEYIDIGSIDNQTQTIRDPKSFLGGDAPSRARRVVHTGDVLFSTVRTYLKNIAMVPETLDGMLTSTGIAVLRPGQAVDGRYLFNWVKSDEFIATMSSAQDGTLYPAVTDKDVAGALIPVPPLPEQKRIVAKVDGLTARTARARTDLARIPTLMAQYKQRILALAFSGELTTGWRSSTEGGEIQGADMLDVVARQKEQIRQERSIRNNGRNRSLSVQSPDLPALPSSWAWATFNDCSWDLTVGHVGPMKDRYVDEGIPFLRSLNIRENFVDLQKVVYIDEKFHGELRKSEIRAGELVVVRTGAPGTAAVVPETLGRANCSDLVIARLVPAVNPHYAAYYMNSQFARSAVRGMQVGVAQQHFNVGAMSQMPVPVAPEQEQTEIVRRIESAFNWLDRMAADHDAASKLLPKLDAAILAKAFRGELAPQDPNDEPASMLLERIQAERAAAPKKPRDRRSVAVSEVGEIRLLPVQVSVSAGPVAIRETRGGQAMTKSRQDDDVMEQPYLAGLIKKGSAGTAKDLFKASDLPIADFYKQLAWEIEHKHIRDDDEKLEAF